MAEDKKTFLQGKMNGDIDARLLPKGEYRSAQNIQISTSEDQDVGTVQNILGNSLIEHSYGNDLSYSNTETIGCFFDEKNNKIFYFVTNYTCPNPLSEGLVGDIDGPKTALQQQAEGITSENPEDLFCGIFVYDKSLNSCKLIVSGLFLNFSKTNEINGVNILEKLLFWTDGLNQPRKINIVEAEKNSAYYNTEEKISVAKFAPFMPPLLLDYDTTTLNSNSPTVSEPTQSLQSSSSNSFPDNQIKEKFVRFSYRFKFKDGEYSTIAPFTQICFIPKTTSYNITQTQEILKRGKASFQDDNGNPEGMVNDVNAVNLNIILPSKNITTDFEINGIEIIYKESDNNLLRAVELVDIKDIDSSNGVFQYQYKSTLPYKTLPQDQTTRVYDNIPLSAIAQEAVGNRIIYGNFVQDRALPNQNNGAAGLDFQVGVDAKYDITNPLGNSDFNNYYLHKEYPFHSIKEKRTYEVGVVLSDKFGRQSPVLTSIKGLSSVKVDNKDSNFHSSSWDNVGTISSTSPGNENYCGDALNITFNKVIPNAYGDYTIVNDVAFNADGSVSYNVSVETILIQDDNLGLVGKLTVSGNNIQGRLQAGDYLKGASKDFVKVLSVEFGSNTVVLADGLISESYRSTTTNPDGITEVLKPFENYRFFKYNINTYGWYSYRVVVKQVEQEYHNVYASNIINYDNDQDDIKTYLPISGDSINKVTRDKEFTNTQEIGVSTSKSRLYPKITPSESDGASSIQNYQDDIDVISIGTAKEQGLLNEDGFAFSFTPSLDKNPLLAELPYGNSSLEIGSETTSGLAGVEKTLITNGSTSFTAGQKVLNVPTATSDRADTLALFPLGSYLKGKSKDLVKIIKHTSAEPCLIECDNSISDNYLGLSSGQKFKIYNYKYGVQERLSVLETMPFESALDIYYETSTAGYVHELNEGIEADITPGDFTTLNINIAPENVSEEIIYWDEVTGNATNNFSATLNITNNNGNVITVGDQPGQIHDPQLVLPSKNYKIISCIGSKWAGDNQDLTESFEIVYDSTIEFFKIRPKVNLFFNRFEAPSFFSFIIELSVVKEDGSIQTVSSPFELTLDNEEPIITSDLSPDVVHIFEPDLSATNNVNQVIYTIEAENGGATNKESGLRYYSIAFNDIIPNIIGREGFIPTSSNPEIQAVIDTEGNIVPELFINETTGEISINSNFQGYLNKDISVTIYDNKGFDHDNFGAGVNLEDVEPREFITETITIKVSSSFIVILPQTDYFGTDNNGVGSNTGFFSTPNSFYLEDIRQGDSFELNGTEMFGNFSWSAGDAIAAEAGTFLCAGQFKLTGESFGTFQGGSTTVSQAWGLTKGFNGEPILKLYRKEDGDDINTLISPSTGTGEGQYGTSYYNTSGVNNPTNVSTRTSEENNSNPQDWDSQPEPWFPDEIGNIVGYSTSSALDLDQVAIDLGFNINFFKGAFGVAEEGNENITKRVSLPLNREGNTDWVNQPSQNLGLELGDPTALQDGNWMFLAKETFTDGNDVEYNVLYEVEHLNSHQVIFTLASGEDNIEYNFWNPRLKKVILCKKPL